MSWQDAPGSFFFMTSGSPPSHRWVTENRTLADGENASRERFEKLIGTVLEITPIGVKLKNRPTNRLQATPVEPTTRSWLNSGACERR